MRYAKNDGALFELYSALVVESRQHSSRIRFYVFFSKSKNATF